MDAPPYKRVSGLFLAWEDDGGANAWRDGVNEFKEQIDKLMDVLESCYNFDVESWFIPSDDSSRALDAKLTELMKKGDESSDSQRTNSTLLIVYYGGHAIPNPKDAADLLLVPQERNSPSGPKISWASIMPQKLLSVRAADTLLILDCCYASRAQHCLETFLDSPTNAVVMLAAATDDCKTTTDGKFTFTKNVRKQFKDHIDTSFAVRDFYVGLRSRARRWRQGVGDRERSCIHIPHCWTTSSTDDRSMVMSSISAGGPASTAPSSVVQAVERMDLSGAQQRTLRPEQDPAMNRSPLRQSGNASSSVSRPGGGGQGHPHATQAQEAFQSYRPNITRARRASIDTDSTVSHSSDSEIDWEDYKSSPAEPVPQPVPQPEAPKARTRHSPTPEPPGIFNQFLPDNVVTMNESDDAPGSLGGGFGFWSWFSSLPKPTRPYSPPPAPQTAYDSFSPDAAWSPSSDRSDDRRDSYPSASQSEPATRDGPGETHSASTEGSSSGVDVPSRTSTPDKAYHPDAPKLEEFLSQWD